MEEEIEPQFEDITGADGGLSPENEGQDVDLMRDLYLDQKHPLPEQGAFSNEALAEQLKGLARDGYEIRAMDEAPDKLIYKIDHRDYIVIVDKDGNETPIESENEEQLREIVVALQAEGQFLKIDPKEALGKGIVAQENLQEVKEKEVGRYFTFFKLNADNTYEMFMAEEVKIEEPQEVSPPDYDDDPYQDTAKPSPFSLVTPKSEPVTPVADTATPLPPKTEVVTAAAAASETEPAVEPAVEPVIEEKTFWEINDPYDYDDYEPQVVPTQAEPAISFSAQPAPVEIQTPASAEAQASPSLNETGISIEQPIFEATDEYDHSYEDDDAPDVPAEQPLILQTQREEKPFQPVTESYDPVPTTAAVNFPETPEVIELGIVDQSAEQASQESEPKTTNQAVETLSVQAPVGVRSEPEPAVFTQDYIRVEKFVVVENTIVQVAEFPAKEAHEEQESAAEPEREEAITQASEDIIISEEDVQEVTQDIAEVPAENSSGIEIQIVDGHEPREVNLEPAQVIEEVEAAEKAEVAARDEAQAKPKVKLEAKLAEEPIQIVQTNEVVQPVLIEKPQETAQPVQIEKNDPIPVIKKESEPIKVPENKAAPAVKVEAQPVRLEKADSKLIAKPEVTAPKVEAKNVEAKKTEEPKNIKAPAKEIVKPEPIKLEKVEVRVAQKIEEKPAIKVAEAPKVEAKPETQTRAKNEVRVIEKPAIQIIAQGAEISKVSPTRGESRVIIGNDHGQQFRNSASPIKVSLNQQEGVKTGSRQDSVAKILDQNEKDNAYTPATQNTGIRIASIAH